LIELDWTSGDGATICRVVLTGSATTATATAAATTA